MNIPEESYKKFKKDFENIIEPVYNDNREIIFFCIGTDKYPGDSIGPEIGTILYEKLFVPNTFVYGTNTSTVNNINFKKKYAAIKKAYPNSFIICIDACMGNKEKLNKISIIDGIKPRAALGDLNNKIGDIGIIINNLIECEIPMLAIKNYPRQDAKLLANKTAEIIIDSMVKLFKRKEEIK